MFQWLKKFLLVTGNKPLTYGDKVKQILELPIDLRKLYNTETQFVFATLPYYTYELESIMKQDILNKDLLLTLVSEDKIQTLTFLEFLGSDGKIPLDPIGDIRKFINVLDRFHNFFLLHSSIKGNITLSTNLRYIQIHIIYIRRIIDTVYSTVQQPNVPK